MTRPVPRAASLWRRRPRKKKARPAPVKEAGVTLTRCRACGCLRGTDFSGSCACKINYPDPTWEANP